MARLRRRAPTGPRPRLARRLDGAQPLPARPNPPRRQRRLPARVRRSRHSDHLATATSQSTPSDESSSPTAPMFVIPHGNFIDVLPADGLPRRGARGTRHRARRLRLRLHRQPAALQGPRRAGRRVQDGRRRPLLAAHQWRHASPRVRRLDRCARAPTIRGSSSGPYDYAPGEAFVRVLQASEVIVLPFRASTTSGSLVQALSWPRPCIVPRMGCLPTQMDDDAGILYRARRPRGARSRPFATPAGSTSTAARRGGMAVGRSRRLGRHRASNHRGVPRMSAAHRARTTLVARPFRRPRGWPTCGRAAPPPPSPTRAPRSTSGSRATTQSLPDLPERQAGYYHEFFCPDHAVQLVFNPRDGHHHACPVDGRVFSGEPFDSAWGWSVNDALSDAALRAAVRRALGHVPGRADADAALLRHDPPRLRGALPDDAAGAQGLSGRRTAACVCWSALDESVWIIRLVWAAALARDAFTPAELTRPRARASSSPALEQLHRVRYQQIQNVGNWDRGAILTLGAAPRRRGRRRRGPRRGVRHPRPADARRHGRRAVVGALALVPLLRAGRASSWTMRALRAAGRAFDREDVVRRMFQAPLDLAFPDTTLPATNDCWYHIGLTGEVGHGIPNADGFYEMAFGWFGDPMFAWVVGENRPSQRPARHAGGAARRRARPARR